MSGSLFPKVAGEGPGLGSRLSRTVCTSLLGGPPGPSLAPTGGAPAIFQVAFLTIPRGPCSSGHPGMVLGRRGNSRHLVPAEFGFSSGRLPHPCTALQGPQWGRCAHLRRSKVGSTVGLKRPGEASQVGTRDPLGISSRLYTEKAVFSFILLLKTHFLEQLWIYIKIGKITASFVIC